MTKILALNARLQKLALSHPLARYNKTIAVIVAAATAYVGQRYGDQAVSTLADFLSVVSVFWVPNAEKSKGRLTGSVTGG